MEIRISTTSTRPLSSSDCCDNKATEFRAEQLSPPLATQVHHALKQTIHQGVPRLKVRRYISMYEAEPSHNEVLLSLAKWWMGLDFKRKLPLARDRLVEVYFWTLGVHFEPELVLVRRMTTKVIAVTSVLDDIYDIYGTHEELELFTQAIQRRDIECINELPEYMQVFYKALIDIYVEIEDVLACTGRSYCLYYAMEAFEQSREHADSAVQCYMKQYGVTEREAENDLRKQGDDAWKDMNEQCLRPTTIAMPLLMGILNLTRVMDVLSKDGGDHYTNPHITLKDYIKSVLMVPVQ
ncbi:hypothetical protein NL676_027307 [Syzygium grande]|nr:hypothetical protein NL676_027307 [Syzygium grande]